MSRLSLIDQLITGADSVLRTLSNSHQAQRQSPSKSIEDSALTPVERRHSAGLMRVNHTGEVCAQALYQGQALTAKLTHVLDEMKAAAGEEIDHLDWCHERLKELSSRPSLLNGVWYAGSFAIGAVAGLIGDKTSLGFVAATEEQVCEHLQSHLQKLPAKDQKSRAIINAMIIDEKKHAQTALDNGGKVLPTPAKLMMKGMAKVMTTTTYYL